MKFDLERIKGNVVHCNTEKKANLLLEFLHNRNYNWNGGDKLLNDTSWESHKDNTCYCISENYNTITYGSLQHFVGYLHLYDILKFEDVVIEDKLVSDKPRICEELGVELGEKFNIKFYNRNPVSIKYSDDKEDKKILVVDTYGMIEHTLLTKLIEHPEIIKKIPRFTEEQNKIFKALKVLGFKYIAKDNSEYVYAYTNKPEKGLCSWNDGNDTMINISHLEDILFNIIRWEDEKPFEITLG